MSNWEHWKDTAKTIHSSEHSTYARGTDIEAGLGECEMCQQQKTILSIDSSAGEYNSFNCCKPCFDKLWDKT